MTTKELEIIAYKALWKKGTYLCFEVAMPKAEGVYSVKERVDLLSYDTNNIWRFYELKISKQDFYSKSAHTFYGHYNNYIMPRDVYEQVHKDIPKDIGVYVPTTNNRYLLCIKRPKKQIFTLLPEQLMFNFMQAFSREYYKYRQTISRRTNA